MLTTIRNAQAVKHETVKIPYAKVSFGIAELLKKEGWIKEAEVKEKGNKKSIILTLKYNKEGAPVISGIDRVSKPGKRIYAGYSKVPVVKQGYGLALVSTPKGLMTSKQARKEKVGGEILFTVY